MENTMDRKARDSEFWKRHILQSKEFGGSNLDYCRQNGLSPSSFSTQKRRLGFRSPRAPRRSAFVKLSPAPLLPHPMQGPHSQARALPDPKWLAQLVLSLTSER
jgi:hypothetical protein